MISPRRSHRNTNHVSSIQDTVGSRTAIPGKTRAGSTRPRHGVRHTGSDGTRWECADAERCPGGSTMPDTLDVCVPDAEAIGACTMAAATGQRTPQTVATGRGRAGWADAQLGPVYVVCQAPPQAYGHAAARRPRRPCGLTGPWTPWSRGDVVHAPQGRYVHREQMVCPLPSSGTVGRARLLATPSAPRCGHRWPADGHPNPLRRLRTTAGESASADRPCHPRSPPHSVRG